MRYNGIMKLWSAYLYVLGLFALLYVVSLLGFYFNAALILGKFPVYGNPDPKELSFYWVYAPIVILTGSLWLFTIMPWFFSVGIYLVVKRNEIDWKTIILSAICQIGAIALLFSGISEWFAD